MIVFTVTNNITDEVWVGTTRDSSAERWDQYKEAMAAGASHPFYKDLRDFGSENFTLDDFAVAEGREDLKDLFEEAMETYDGKSLAGVKTKLTKEELAKVRAMEASIIEASLPKATAQADDNKPDEPALRIPNQKRLTAPSLLAKSKPAAAPKKPLPTPASGNRSFGVGSASKSTRAIAQKAPAKEKLSNGRTGSASKEKQIKEAIAAEKAARESVKAKQIMEQADEMKAIMARLDSRGSTLKKR